MGLATIDPHSLKEHTEIYKIPKFGVNRANSKQDTAMSKFTKKCMACRTDSSFCLVQSLNSPFFPPNIGAEPGRAKGESRITCMRMLRTTPFFFPQIGGKTIFGSAFQIWLVALFSE